MYFASRLQAGRMLGTQLAVKYRYENCAVVALNDGGVMVGAQIASQLHCVLMLLQSAEINLPQEPDAIAGITADGELAYNKRYSQGETDELVGEYFGYIEQEKIKQMHNMNRLMGSNGVMNKDLLKGHNVIVVSDGLKTGFPLDLAAEFLKPIAIDRFIVATPFASVQAVDRMHVVTDEIYCLDVVDNIVSVDHYYDVQDVPDHEAVVRIINQIITHWQ